MNQLAAIVASGLLLCASSAFAEATPHIVSAAVRSYESEETLTRTTCGLPAIADVGGHARLFDVAVGGKRCSSLPPQADAVPLRVRIVPRDDQWRVVVFEADVTEGTSEREMRSAVDAVARELLVRFAPPRLRMSPPVAESTEQKVKPDYPVTRRGSIALMAVGGAMLGLSAVIGLAALVDGAGHTGSKDFSGYGVAMAIAGGIGLVSLVTGGILLSYAPPKSAVSMHLGPTGGSIRVAF